MDTDAPDSFCLCLKFKPDLLWEPEPTWVSAEADLFNHAETPVGLRNAPTQHVDSWLELVHIRAVGV